MKKFLCVLLAMLMIFSLAIVPAFAESVTPVTGPVDVLTEYAWVIFAGIVCLIVAGVAVYTFIKKPRAEQLEKLKEWLLWAVIEAERIFGTETGVVKLRYVYNLFVVTFPWLERIITFEKFKGLVDEALERMEKLLLENNKIKEYIEGAENIEAPAPVVGFASEK